VAHFNRRALRCMLTILVATLRSVGRHKTAPSVPLEVYSDITDATEQCYAPRCLSIFAQNFARKSLTVADTLVGCSSNTPNVSAPGLILCPKLTLRRSLLISVLSSTSPIKHAKSPSLACSPIKDSRAGVTRTAKGRLNAISCVTIVSIL
jgi:hypothetical protein